MIWKLITETVSLVLLMVGVSAVSAGIAVTISRKFGPSQHCKMCGHDFPDPGNYSWKCCPFCGDELVNESAKERCQRKRECAAMSKWKEGAE